MNPENVSDEMLMALADGELPETEAASLQARIARDTALADRFAIFAETRAALGAALDPGPVPDRLVQAVMNAQTAETVVPLRPRRAWAATPVWGSALAASLVLAAGLGGYLLGQQNAVTEGTATPLAAARALSGAATGAAIELAGGSTARVLASFDTDQGFCRLLALSGTGDSNPGSRIVACRDQADWQVLLTVADGGDSFVTASDTAVEMVDDLLDRLGAGPALSAEEETARMAD